MLTLPPAVRSLRRRVRPVRAAIDALLAGGMRGMSGASVTQGIRGAAQQAWCEQLVDEDTEPPTDFDPNAPF